MKGLRYKVVEGLPEGRLLEGVLDLHSSFFGATDGVAMKERLEGKVDPTVVVAILGDEVVGYKIGYGRKPGRYYSWVGGVRPDHRRRGIARRMMEMQHRWCVGKGYRTVRTKTKNRWKGMLILDLREGFDVIGAYTDELGEAKLILEKRLDTEPHGKNG